VVESLQHRLGHRFPSLLIAVAIRSAFPRAVCAWRAWSMVRPALMPLGLFFLVKSESTMSGSGASAACSSSMETDSRCGSRCTESTMRMWSSAFGSAWIASHQGGQAGVAEAGAGDSGGAVGTAVSDLRTSGWTGGRNGTSRSMTGSGPVSSGRRR
jgi:hypothetical protein